MAGIRLKLRPIRTEKPGRQPEARMPDTQQSIDPPVAGSGPAVPETEAAARWTSVGGPRRDDERAPPGAGPAPRCEVALPVSVTTIDPGRDPGNGQRFYESCERQQVLNLSATGACLRCERPPAEGARLLLRLLPPGQTREIDLVAQTRWARFDYVRGRHGGQLSARVGVELVGGSVQALARYGEAIQGLTPTELDGPHAVG